MKILATYNLKGGVGKTTTAVNISHQAAKEGFRTLLWDLDPQGAASFYFRIKPGIKGGSRALIRRKVILDDIAKATDYDGLDLIPADFSFRHFDEDVVDTKRPVRQLLKIMRPVSQEYDLLVIDSAPSISLAAENIFYAADALLIPLIPTTLSVRTYSQLLNYFRKSSGRHLILLPFFSMYNKKRTLHRTIREALPKEHSEILDTIIPESKRVELMGVKRAPVGHFAPQSKQARAYRQLWGEVREQIFPPA